MEKYRFIGKSREDREYGKIYNGKSKMNAWCYPVSKLAIKHPDEWELIK